MEINLSTLAAVAVVVALGVILLVTSTGKKEPESNAAAGSKAAVKKTKVDAAKPKPKTAPAAVTSAAPKPAKEAVTAEEAVKRADGEEDASNGGDKKKKKKNKKGAKKAEEGEAPKAPAPAKTVKVERDDAALESPKAEVPKKKVVDGAADDEKRRREQQEAEDSITAMNLANAEYAAFNTGGKVDEAGAGSADAGWGIAGQKKKNKKKGSNANVTSSVEAAGARVESEKPTTESAAAVPIASSDAHHHLGLPAMQYNDNTAVLVPENAVSAVPTEISKSVKVESKRLGVIIGPKGVTKIAIQDATSTEIRTPRLDPEAKDKDRDSSALVDVEVIGSQDWEVNAAIKAVKDMASKGYCALLAGENFSEGSITVHSTFLPELIGKGGGVLKTLQNHYNVKITVPQVPRDSKTDCKVMVVGDKKDVKRAKECIKVLCKYHHTEITHPGMCHDEMELDASVHGYVIGYKGSMIHHIQKNYKVAIHIPGPYSLHEHVLVVGEPDDVRRAVIHIQKEVEKALEPKQTQEEVIAAEATAAVATDQEEEALEPWMEAYIKKGGSTNVDFAI